MFLLFVLSLPAFSWAGSVPLPAIDIARLDTAEEIFSQAILTVGSVALTGLGADYSEALARLNRNAPSCTEGFYEMELNDGSVRMTFGKDSTETEKDFPGCVTSDLDIIEKSFDTVDSLITTLLDKTLGRDMLVVMNNSSKLHLEDLPTRTHMHVYKTENTMPSPRLLPSYPYHTDNGLYLLVTPAPSQPLAIRSRQGLAVSTDHLPSDSVIFIVGGGLSSWILPSLFPLTPFAAPHAVPSLSSTYRTVLARMKVAPPSSTPLHSLTTFQSHFSSTQSNTGLCPLTTWDMEHQAMCEEGEALCWMDTCLPVPGDCTNTPVCVNEVLEPCCTPDVTTDCEAHDESCHWTC